LVLTLTKGEGGEKNNKKTLCVCENAKEMGKCCNYQKNEEKGRKNT